MPKLRALIMALLAALGIAAGSLASSDAASPRADTSASYKTGIGNENPKMFKNTYWTRLHTKIVRYIAPYDAAVKPYSMERATRFLTAAEAAHQEILVAFYHSEYSPTRLPGVGQYQHDVQKFIHRFPHVKQYQAWDEANRGNVPHAFSSPSAELDARYYQALIRVCHGCAVIGLDVLDATSISPTLRYISEFKSEIGKLKTIMPRVWGLHNYADLNTLSGERTPIVVRALGGEVWLTETGGIVKFANAFTDVRGSGLRRAVKVLDLMFRVAAAMPQIKRIYIYDWTGGTTKTRFDAGLMNSREQPRPGYNVVCHKLRVAKCATRLSKT